MSIRDLVVQGSVEIIGSLDELDRQVGKKIVAAHSSEMLVPATSVNPGSLYIGKLEREEHRMQRAGAVEGEEEFNVKVRYKLVDAESYNFITCRGLYVFNRNSLSVRISGEPSFYEQGWAGIAIGDPFEGQEAREESERPEPFILGTT